MLSWRRALKNCLFILATHFAISPLNANCRDLLLIMSIGASKGTFLRREHVQDLKESLVASCGHFCSAHIAAIATALQNKTWIAPNPLTLASTANAIPRGVSIADGAKPLRTALAAANIKPDSYEIKKGKSIHTPIELLEPDYEFTNEISLKDISSDEENKVFFLTTNLKSNNKSLPYGHAWTALPYKAYPGFIWLLNPSDPTELYLAKMSEIKVLVEGKEKKTIELELVHAFVSGKKNPILNYKSQPLNNLTVLSILPVQLNL